MEILHKSSVIKDSKNDWNNREGKVLLTSQKSTYLYNTKVYPYLSYCNITWTSTYPSRLQILSIVMIQKKLVRIMTFSNYKESSKHLFTSLQIVEINELNKHFVALFMYSFFNNKLPSNFENSF